MRSIFPHFVAIVILVSAVSGQRKAPETDRSTSQSFNVEVGRSFSASNDEPEKRSGVLAYVRDRGRIESDLAEALTIIQKKSVERRPDAIPLLRSALDGALLALDPHSTYFDAAEFRELMEEQQSEYSGIGATIANFKHGEVLGTYVVATIAGSPAAGRLAFGDQIVEVDGQATSGRPSNEVRELVRGQSGSIVKLLIESAATGKTQLVELRRRLVPQPSIADAYMLRSGIGYIDLTSGFNYTTSGEFSAALKALHARGMTGLIIDLRGNPGGILEQAVRVAEKFLPAGSLIVSQRGRSNADNRVWRSTNRAPETIPLVVLVDSSSASASEILAGALQDHDRALIVGERTFGKGLVQSVISLPLGAGLTLTTARYFTPSGRSIQRDYSTGNLYDYYNHRENTAIASRPASTAGQRRVFGGDGIEPDEVLAAKRLSISDVEQNDRIFFFVRTVLRSGRQSTVAAKRDEEWIAEFASANVRQMSSTVARPSGDDLFVNTRLRFNLALALKGAAAANRVLIAADPQVIKAAEALPRARQMALSNLDRSRK